MKDLALWRALERPRTAGIERLIPELAELARLPLVDRWPFLARVLPLAADARPGGCAPPTRRAST